MKKQIRLFSGPDPKYLEAEVNLFLSGKPAEAIKSISLSESACKTGHLTVAILYETED